MFDKFNFELIYSERNELTPLVVMMCGVAGSGKTTFSQILEEKVLNVFLLMKKYGLLKAVGGLISQ
ncbi:hypothetical protein UACE39S_03202 [Ureibacillus acetophenoni]